ncbi:MAG TPA: hypothetical protein PL070_09295 [Flavobacteriales bacterium]|nr:hypothetical protein [Flavobacteriales bacterium]
MKSETKTIYVKIVLTERGQVEAAVGPVLPLLGKWFKEFSEEVERYRNDGYTISAEDPERGTFTATKQV